MPTSQTSNKKNSSLKTLLIVLGAAVVIFAIILFLGSRSGGNEATSTGLVTQSTGARVPAGSLGDTNSTARRSDQIVSLLNSVSAIKLDDSIFRNPAFSALRDINSTLPADRNPGRENPFLPIGQESPSPTSTVFQQSDTSAGDTTSDAVVSTGDAALQDFVETSTPGQ